MDRSALLTVQTAVVHQSDSLHDDLDLRPEGRAAESVEQLPKMNIQEIRAIVGLCTFPEYTFEVQLDHRGALYLQAHYMEPDVVTQVPERQFTRRWFLSPAMCKSEIVQTVFKCVMTSAEHRVREHFKYQARAIFGPHFKVDSLWMICDEENIDYRGKQEFSANEEQLRKEMP